MNELYRLTRFIISSRVASRQWALWPCVRFSRLSHSVNSKALINLSSRIITNDCRQLLNKAEMSSHMKFPASTTGIRNCDEAADESLNASVHSTMNPSDSLEEESGQTELDVSGIVPALPKKSFSLSSYVNDSTTLHNLVMLGVNLAKIEERDISVAEQLLKLDFEHDVKPVLLFLYHCDVKECDIGGCITKNPHLLCESIDDMQVRVNYLKSKRFSKESIARIVSKEPRVLTTATKETDAQLGYLQQEFMLSGTELYIRTYVSANKLACICTY